MNDATRMTPGPLVRAIPGRGLQRVWGVDVLYRPPGA